MEFTNEEMEFVKNKLDTLGDLLNNFPKGGKLIIHKDGTHTLMVPKINSMIEIFEKYQTDKNSKGHNYAPYYEKHLPKTASKILEIGVDKGQSILMWHEIFPEAHIYGLDLFQENPIPFQDDFVTWFKGNQADSKLLDDVRTHGDFDVVIDDGSHWARHVWMTFYGLIGCCKLYVVEDLHCQEEFWRQKMGAKDTMIAHMKAGTFPFKFDLYNDQIAFIYP